MSFHWSLYFCLFLALWAGLVGGVFKAFSEFIMTALGRARPASAIEVMQQINITVLRTEFVGAILSIAVFSCLFAVYAVFSFDGYSRAVLVLAAFVYIPAVFLVTLFGNVPMNERLAVMDHGSRAAVDYWHQYGRDWTRLNHWRTGGSILTAGLYLVAAISLIASEQV